MKSITESARVMAAYAEIDYCYFMLKQLIKNNHTSPRNVLDVMIDRLTGYDEFTFKQKRKNSIYWLNQIIKNKKIIEADYSYDEKILTDIVKLK